MFVCKKCQKVDVPRRGNRRKCLECEGAYLKEWKAARPQKQRAYNQRMNAHRRVVKQICVEYLGGECKNEPHCFYPRTDDAAFCPMTMEFHHRDPNGKDFEISRWLRTKGINKVNSVDDLKAHFPEVVAELDKCVLLCGNCHAHLEYCSNCTRS